MTEISRTRRNFNEDSSKQMRINLYRSRRAIQSPNTSPYLQSACHATSTTKFLVNRVTSKDSGCVRVTQARLESPDWFLQFERTIYLPSSLLNDIWSSNHINCERVNRYCSSLNVVSLHLFWSYGLQGWKDELLRITGKRFQ